MRHRGGVGPGRLLLALGLVSALLGGCGADEAGDDPGAAHDVARAGRVLSRIDLPLLPSLFSTPTPAPAPPPADIAPLWSPSTPLSAPAFDIPLDFVLPRLGVSAPVMAVGRRGSNLIDAPEGPANDPVWRKAFLFRGGARPGQPGVTTIIGHVDDTLARPDPFAAIRQLQAGDIISILDQRINRSVHYRVTSTRIVWNTATRSPAELESLFGAYAVTGRAEDQAKDAADGARLTLMTCTGRWRNGGFDRRFFVFAVRDESPAVIAAG